jgi:putative transposase
MSHSLSKIYVHIILSTKHRQPVLIPNIQPKLHRHITEICNNLECIPLSIGGASDHIHILCNLSKEITLMNLILEIKTGSARWIKTIGKEYSGFHWQDGYGSFSVNPIQTEPLVRYIANQFEYHRKKTFQEEYRMFLKKFRIEFDEQNVWD